MTETIEGTAVDISEERALVVAQPGQALVSRDTDSGPTDMIGVATRLATALKDIVERQKLYTVIQGRKFPQVEAWMTIGRMDNVVARESQRPIRNEDGSYEAFVELVRLSDGMVVGGASAMCGAPDDAPWGGTPAKYGKPALPARPEHQRRSMAVTRATSRAFRQQYSWIMTLAGYEPTPADEMPHDDVPPAASPTPRPNRPTNDDGSLVGIAEKGKGQADFELRQTPDGMKIEFRLTSGRGGIKVVAIGPLAEALHTVRDAVIGQRVSCWGHIKDETFRPKGATKDVTYQVMTLEKIQTPDVTLPADDVPLPAPPEDVPLVGETADSPPLFDDLPVAS